MRRFFRQNAGQQRAAAADEYARSLAPLFAELTAVGFVNAYTIAEELNRRRVRQRLGNFWVPAAVYKVWRRMLRLGVLDPNTGGFGHVTRYHSHEPTRHSRAAVDRNRQALRDRADTFARQVAPLLSQLREDGHTTYQSIADALNAQGIAPQRGQHWTPARVKNLCARLRDIAARDEANTVPSAP